jgi:transposase
MGWHYREEEDNSSAYWTQKHKTWLKEKLNLAPEHVKFNFKIIEAQMNDLEERLNQYEVEFIKIAEQEKYKEKVKSLVCYRGIDILSAMILITEIGDVRRFSHPKKLSSYAGFDIREYSSGGIDRKFSITKMGNKHIRRILVETAQNYNRVPIIGKDLRNRRLGVSPKYTEIADRCMHRIYKKGKHLWHKGKAVNKVKTACAREILGFIWESLKLATV